MDKLNNGTVSVHINETVTLRQVGTSVAGDPIYTTDSEGAVPVTFGASDSEKPKQACESCSRLASRVEELEGIKRDDDLAFEHANEVIGKMENDTESLKKTVENLMFWNRKTMELCDKMMADRHITRENIFTGGEPKINWDFHRDFLAAANKQAEQALAGAHAEEKE